MAGAQETGKLMWGKLPGHPWWPCRTANPELESCGQLDDPIHPNAVNRKRKRKYPSTAVNDADCKVAVSEVAKKSATTTSDQLEPAPYRQFVVFIDPSGNQQALPGHPFPIYSPDKVVNVCELVAIADSF